MKSQFWLLIICAFFIGLAGCQQEEISPKNTLEIGDLLTPDAGAPNGPEAFGVNIEVENTHILGCKKLVIDGAAYYWWRQIQIELKEPTANFYGTLYYTIYCSDGSVCYTHVSNSDAPKFWVQPGATYTYKICNMLDCTSVDSPTYSFTAPSCSPGIE